MTGKWKASWAAALTIVLLAGCGGSDPEPSDRDQIQSTVLGYLNALGDGDGKKACGYLGSSPQEDIVARSGAKSCEDGIARAGSTTEEGKERIRLTKVTSVTVDGSTANAKVSTGVTVSLERLDGRWRIAEFPPLPDTSGQSAP